MLTILLLLWGVFCCSTSVLMIKASGLHPAVLSSYRLLLAALLLWPLYSRAAKAQRAEHSLPRQSRLTVAAGLALALHFISWASGAQKTGAANASLIVNMVPVAMPFLMWAMAREKVRGGEVLGTVIALVGVAWLVRDDFAISHQSLAGDLTCLASMLLFSLYLALGRSNRQESIWLYVVPLYALAGAACFVISLVVADPLKLHPARDYLLALGLAVVPTIMGHSALNYAMKNLRSQIVSVANLLQFLFAGALAYAFFGEAPRGAFFIAGALVVAGAVIVIQAGSSGSLSPQEAAEASET